MSKNKRIRAIRNCLNKEIVLKIASKIKNAYWNGMSEEDMIFEAAQVIVRELNSSYFCEYFKIEETPSYEDVRNHIRLNDSE